MAQLTIDPGAKMNFKVLDNMSFPGIMDGLKLYAGQVDLDDTKTCILTLKCKSIISAVVSCAAGTALVSTSLTGTTATVTITKSTNGVVNFMILASETENTQQLAAATANVTIAEDGTTG